MDIQESPYTVPGDKIEAPVFPQAATLAQPAQGRHRWGDAAGKTVLCLTLARFLAFPLPPGLERGPVA